MGALLITILVVHQNNKVLLRVPKYDSGIL